MRQTEEKNELVSKNQSNTVGQANQTSQERNERKRSKKTGMVVAIVGAIVMVLVIAFVIGKNSPGGLIQDLFKCENHVDSNLDLICDECKNPIPCLDGQTHADVNSDLLCDNCGAAIASSDVSVYKEIENEEQDETKVNVRGNMPTDSKVAIEEISRDDAITLAQKFMDIESKDVIDAYDITMNVSENIKYQPADDGEKVKVTISNLNIDPSKGLAMMHIIDENNYEMIPLNRATKNEIEFTTNRFSTYILVTVGTSKIEFSGLGKYTVLDSENIPLVSGVTISNTSNFEFKIMPIDNYSLGNIVLKNASGTVINPSTDGTTGFTMTDYGAGKACKISSVTQNYTISVENNITLTNPITLTAITDGAWTNKDIVVEIDWPVTNFTNQIKIDNGEWIEYNDPTYTMTSSGTLYARVFDGDQGGGEVSVAVNNIDKVAPVVTKVYRSIEEWTTGSVTAKFNAADEGSGISAYYTSSASYYLDDTNYNRYKKNITPTMTLSGYNMGTASSYTTFYARCSDQAGNISERVSITISNIDEREPLFSNPGDYSNADFLYYAPTYATQSFTDPTFVKGNNSVSIYNNHQNGMVKIERVSIADEGIEKCPVSDSGYVMKIQNIGPATPQLGGFVQSKDTMGNGVYIHKFYAKIPVGYTLTNHNNAVNGECKWLTSKTGTGEWQEYAYMWRCYSNGGFSTFGHITINGTQGTQENPITWYLGYATMYDATHMWDDIDVTYSDEKAAVITINAYDYLSGIKNITVNGVEVPIDQSKSTYTDKVLTHAVANYSVTEPGTYEIIATDNVGRTSKMTRTAYLITYDPNPPAGVQVTGETIDQIKIGYVSNARRSKNSSTYSWKVSIRDNGYTNSAGTPFRGWATSPTGLAAYSEGAYYETNAGLNLYAVWDAAIRWDVSKNNDRSVLGILIENGDGTYTLKISGTGAMKGWDWKSYSGAPWYDYRTKISHIVVEQGVTNIGGYAFTNVTGLKNTGNVSIADSVTSYGAMAFNGCSEMTGTFNVSQYVTSISTNPFLSASKLNAISVNVNNPNYKDIEGVLFNKAGTRLISYPLGNGLTHYNIPEGTTTIGTHSAANIRTSTISIPSSVTTFEDLCFSGADFVTLSIPSTVTTFSGRPFSSLDYIEKIYFHPTTLTLPHQNTFTNAKAKSVIYTANKAIAGGFIDGKDYTSSRTTLAYPPYFSGHPSNRTVAEGEVTTFSATAVDGVPNGTLTYQWQYRENESADWKNVTSNIGTVTRNGTTTTLTTVPTTLSMNGYDFRCKTGNGIYPGTESQFTEEELTGSIYSGVAKITIIEKNYLYSGVYYETIEEALDVFYGHNAQSHSSRVGTIELVGSNTDSSEFVLNSGYTITLVTNGHTLTKVGTPLVNNGTLIITGTGTITSSSDSAKANINAVIVNNKDLTINGATIRHRGLTTGNYMAIHNATAGSTLTVTSGTVSEDYGLSASSSYSGRAVYSNVASTITVNGGTVSSRTNKTGCSAIEAYGTAKTTIYVYGGTVSSLYGNAVYITSGSASATTSSLIQAEGGTIDAALYGIKYDTGVISTLRVNGARVAGHQYGVTNYGTGEILLMSGSIHGDIAGIITSSNAPVSIKGGTITGNIGILNDTTNTAKVTIYTGSINAETYGIHNAGAGEIRIENGTINGTMYGLYNERTGTINILGGTITANARGIRDDGTGTINIGTKDGVISVTTPLIHSETYGVYVQPGTKLNIYDGKLRGGTAPYVEDTIDDMESGYSMFKTREGNYIAAVLQSGWDISPLGSPTTTAMAVLEQDMNDITKYKLIITGSGPMRDFTTTSMPWLVYREVIGTVDIQDGITNIGDNALYNFRSLTNLSIPLTITSIGDNAFANCTSISGTFEIARNVTSLGTNPFSNATFENITVASGNSNFKVVNNILLNPTSTYILAYPAGNTATTTTIPSTVNTIGPDAFKGSQLTEITIPSNVRTIESGAFDGSKNISFLLIPSTVTSIGNNAFANMTSLETVYIKASGATIGNGSFANMASSSKIYTISNALADKFTSSVYTPANTTLCRPPKITTQPLDQALVCPDPGVFTLGVAQGVPSGVTYQWYIKEADATNWRAVTSSDGTGGTSSTFTTVYTVPDMVGTSYRCIIQSSDYPNAYMTQDEIADDTISKAASLAISGGNYQVDNGLYYPTLQAALNGAGAGTHNISVVVNTEDNSAPVIASNQVITLDMKNKEIEKLTAGIENNGTLTIKNGGIIQTDTDASAGYQKLFANKGTINLESTTLRHNGDATRSIYAIWNEGTFNMTSGAVEVRLNNAIKSSAQYAARGITNFEGAVNISGGTVSVNHDPIEANLKVDLLLKAYAIEGWDSENYVDIETKELGIINVSGTGAITSNGKGIVLRNDTETTVSNHEVNISGGTITAEEYGIWTSEYAEGSINITGGTLTAGDTAIKLESVGLVPLTVSNATITSTNGNGIETSIPSSEITVGTNAVINASREGVVFTGAGTYTQTAGRIDSEHNGIRIIGDANVNITGGTVNTNNGYALLATGVSNNDIELSNVSMAGFNGAVYSYAENNNIKIYSGTYRATGANSSAVCAETMGSNGQLIIGETGKTGPSIIGTDKGLKVQEKVVMNSGSISAKTGVEIGNSLVANVPFTLNAGTISATDVAIKTTANEKIIINAGTISGTNKIIDLVGTSSTTIKNATLTGQNTGITMKDTSTLTMESGTINTSIYGVENTGTGAVNIQSGIVHAGEAGVINSSTGILTIGINDTDENISRTSPEIRSIIAINSPKGFNFYDGILKAINSTNTGEILDWPENYGIFEGTESINGTTYKTKFIAMGWDISANPGVDNVWAFLEKTSAGHRTLTIEGTGATKDYEYIDDTLYSNIPWFEYRDEIDKIVIKNGVTRLGDRLFAKTDGFTTVTIPEGVTSLGTYLFAYCGGSAKTISIPSTVTTMGDNPFGAANVKTLNLASGNTHFKVIDNVLFTYDGTKLISYSIGKTNTEYAIPNGVKIIGDQSFVLGSNLTKVIIPSSVTNIDSLAFNRCTALKEVYVEGTSLKTVVKGAFTELAANSIIYTSSKTVADKFNSTTYSASKTKVYYPPAITTEPLTQTITDGNEAIFSIVVREGVPTDTTYTWKYKSPTATDWANVTSSLADGYNTNTLRIPAVTPELDRYEFKCVITTSGYPNEEMTDEELHLTSNVAVLEVNAANYQVGSQYFNTLREAVNSIETTAETRIEVIQSNAETDAVTIEKTKNIVLDLNDKTISASNWQIVNKGTLTLTGEGTIDAVVTDREYRRLILNIGTLNINSGTYIYASENIIPLGETLTFVINEMTGATINVSGGDIELSNIGLGSGVALNAYHGIVNVTGGNITSTNYGIFNSGKAAASITISGGNVSADDTAIYLFNADSTGVGNTTTLNISGTADIYGTNYGVSNTFSTSAITITGGTIEGGRAGVHNTTSKTIIGTSGDAILTTTPEIKGGTYGVDSVNGIEFYDGILKGKTATHSGTVTPETGYGLQYGQDGEYKTAILVLTNYTDGTSYYASLKEAFERAPSGATIKPTKNQIDNSDAVLLSGKILTLDLNGMTITRTKNRDFTNGGTLSIKDSIGMGRLEATDDQFLIKNVGVLEILSGTLENTSSGGFGGIIRSDAGTLNVKGGTLNYTKIATTGDGDEANGILISAGTLNYTGGTLNVISKVKSTGWGTDGIEVFADDAIINISGGNILARAEMNDSASNGLTVLKLKSGKVSISGNAKIKAEAQEAGANAIANNGLVDLVINGGTIESTEIGVYNDSSKTIIGTSGSGVSTTTPEIIGGNTAISSESGISFYDGILKGKTTTHSGPLTPESGYGIQYGNDGDYNTAILVAANYHDGTSYYATLDDAFDMAPTNSIITVARDVTENVASNLASGKTMTLDLNGKTITANAGITNNGTLTIKDSSANAGTIRSTATLSAIITQSVGSLTIENVTINADSVNITAAISNIGGTLKLVSGNIYSKKIGISAVAGATTIIGNNSNPVSTTSPLIKATGYAISSNAFTWYDGILKSTNTSVYTGTTTEATHYSPDFNTETLDGTTYYVKWLARDENYQVGSNYYATLVDVLNANPTGANILAIRTCVDDSNPVFPAGYTYTLDFAGLDVIKTSYPITNNGTLNIKGTGEVSSTSGMYMFVNNGTLNINHTGTIENLSSEASSGVIKNVAGTTNINSGTLYAGVNGIEVTGGTLNINAGTITGNAYALKVTSGNILFKDGILKGMTAPLIGNVTTETDKAIYYYTEGSYKCARIEIGWDISKEQDGSLWGYVLGGTTLEVVGSGATLAFTEDTKADIPWHSYKSNINILSLPNGLTEIGDYIFSDLKYINEIKIPNTVTTLGIYSLGGASSVTGSIEIPAAVTTMEGNPFGLTPVTSYTIKSGNSAFKMLNGMLVTTDETRLVSYPYGLTATSVTLPASITTISAQAFRGLKATSITLDDALTSINYGAFMESKLTEIVLPENVVNIYDDAFLNSKDLSKVYMIGTLITLNGDGQFNGLKSGSAVYTREYDVASRFTAGTHYNSSITTIYYPPVMGGTLVDTTINSKKTATFEVTPTLGVPGTLKYIWQVKRVGTDEWLVLMDGQGLNTARYTTPQLTVENSGDEYRCIINSIDGSSKEAYPNTYMPLTDEDMTEKLISNTAKVFVRAANYEVNDEYFATLEDAVFVVPANTQTTINLLTDVEDISTVTIPSSKNIILDLGTDTLNRKNTVITNNGILTIKGTGTLKVESATLIDNKGTLQIKDDAINLVGTGSQALITNSGTTTLDKVNVTTNNTVIKNTAGTSTINGGTYDANGGVNINAFVVSGGTLNYIGGTISSEGTAIYVESAGTANVKGGAINANDTGIYNEGNVTLGNNDASVIDTAPTIIAENYGYTGTAASALAMYDGKVKGKTKSISTTVEIITPEDYDVTFVTYEAPYETAYLVKANYRWKDSWFTTLNDVYEEMARATGCLENEIVYVGENITSIIDNEAVTLDSSKIVTLELNLSNNANIDFTNTLTIRGGVTFKIVGEGTFDGASIKNGGYLETAATIDGAITSTGTMFVKGGTINATVSAGGRLNAESGTITTNVSSSGLVNVSGATLSGGITMSSASSLNMTAGTISNANGNAIVNTGTGSIVITNGIVNGQSRGIVNNSTGSITIGAVNDGTLSSGDPEITGGVYAISTSADFKFYDGMLRGRTAAYVGTVTAVEDGAHIQLDDPSENGTAYYRAYIEDNDVFVETWDISHTPGTDEVYAGVKVIAGDGVNAATRYKLVVWGDGKTMNYQETTSPQGVDTPWYTTYATRITKLELEEGVTKYGNALFANLPNLVEDDLELPKSITALGMKVFKNDAGITGTFKISKDLTDINPYANPFGGTKIETFTVEAGNGVFEVKNEGLYHIADKRLIAYPGGSLTTNPIVADGTLIIGPSAFYGNKTMTTATIPNTVVEIKTSAFDNTSIREITIPSSVTTIRDYAFTNCTSLKKVFLKSDAFTLTAPENFTYMASGSIIYTESKESALKFTAGTHYTAGRTEIYYPFKVTKMPDDFALTIHETISIAPTIREGYIASDVSYQWFLNGEAIDGAIYPVYEKGTVEDSDSGDYTLLIESALIDGEYYYSQEFGTTNLRVRDHVAPESVSIAVTYLPNGHAQTTVTASDTYSGVDKFYLNGQELTTGVTITNDGTGLTGGSGVAVFTITESGTYTIEIADSEDNRATVERTVFDVTYDAGSTYQVTGDVIDQLLVNGFPIQLRNNGFVKTGHTFVEWADAKDNRYAEGEMYSTTSHLYLKAIWQINSYNVYFYNYDADGEVLVESRRYNYEDIITVPGRQMHDAEFVGSDKYKIYRHKGSWKATALGNPVIAPVDITSSNTNAIKMVDSDMRYDVVYEITTYNIGNATVYIDGNMTVSGTNTAIRNDEGVVFIGPMPQISGTVINNNGIIDYN